MERHILSMKRKFSPYNFDEKHEYEIYSQIGKEYYRKWIGKPQKHVCPSFDKYTEWEKYFQQKFWINENNTCNFVHYLKQMLMINKKFEEYFKALVIPCYMTLITITLTVYSSMEISHETLIITLISSLLAVMLICMLFLRLYSNKIQFYRDCINVIGDCNASKYDNSLCDTIKYQHKNEMN